MLYYIKAFQVKHGWLSRNVLFTDYVKEIYYIHTS